MPKRYPRLLLQDILDCIDKITVHTAQIPDEVLLKDTWMCDAMVRNIEIIGEAANRIPSAIREQYPEILWHQIIGMRNRIVHEYADIDLQIVLEIVREDLSVLKEQVQHMLAHIKVD